MEFRQIVQTNILPRKMTGLSFIAYRKKIGYRLLLRLTGLNDMKVITITIDVQMVLQEVLN